MYTTNLPLVLIFILLFLFSCESDADRTRRVEKERQEQIQRNEIKKEREKKLEIERELERIRKEKEQEDYKRQIAEKVANYQREKALREKFLNNSLYNGAKPYAYCYGSNNSCSDYGCSEIKVKTPNNSDVLVTIKRRGDVYRHGYIKAGSSFTFQVPNDTYQTFFYYGKGWNPNKLMTQTTCGVLKGGFIEDELFGKDFPQRLSNNILTYELILQQNGNFSTKPSSMDEVF